jgi:hypothetical protein
MFRIVLADGSIQELPQVHDASVQANSLVCYDELGTVLAVYEPNHVLAFGNDGVIEELARTGELLSESQERQTA